MELEKLFHFGAESAEHLFNRLGHIVPMWVGVSKKGAHIPLMVPDLLDKDAVAETVRKFLRDKDIIQYVSMLECWVYEGKELPPEILAGKSLEDNPDRREAIHILAEDRDGNIVSGQFYILRPEHGRPTLSPLKVNVDSERTEGRFAQMFN